MRSHSRPRIHRSSPVKADSVIAFLRPALGKMYVSNSNRSRIAAIYGVKNPLSKRWTILRKGNPKMIIDVIAVRGNVGRHLQKVDGMVEERVRKGYRCGDGKGPESAECEQIHEDEWWSYTLAGYSRCVPATETDECLEARINIGDIKVYSDCNCENLKRTTHYYRWICLC